MPAGVVTSRIPAAVVGCGRMGAFTSEAVRRHAPACWFPLSHAEAITGHERLSLDAFLDADPDQALRAAGQYGGTAYPDLATLLHVARPKLLGVATRTLGRADIIQKAAGGGVTALHVEKPLCNSMAELDALAGLLATGKLALTLGAIRRHLPPYRAAIAHAAAGHLGPLQDIQVNLGTAPLCWTHPHSIDLILAAAQGRTVADVQAGLGDMETGDSSTEVWNDPIVLWAIIRFSDGTTGRIGRVPGSDLLLSGTDGALAVEADGHRLRILETRPQEAYPQWQDWPHPEGAPGTTGTLAAIDQLVRCIDGDPAAIQQNQLLQEDILTGQRILFAMLQSNAEGGRPVSLANIDPKWCVWGMTHGRHA